MKSGVRAKYVVFSGIAILMVYVLFHNERFLVDPTDPLWQRFEPFKWWLLPHGVAGALVILLAPLQFSDRLRRRFSRLHRVLGRLYVVGAFVLAPLGAYIQYYEEGLGFPRTFTTLAIVNAVMLVVTTGLAFLFAYRRKITLHRQWMIRSYAVALVFLEGRFVLGVTGLEAHGVEVIQAVIWSCLAISPLLGELAVHWNEILGVLSPAPVLQKPARQAVPQVTPDPLTG